MVSKLTISITGIPHFRLIRGDKIDVKYDPFDITVAYAYVQGEWVKCFSRYLWELSGHSVRELMIAASELRKLNKIHFQKFGEITARKLVAFFKRIEMKEALLTPPWLSAKKAIEQQRIKDAELKQVISIVEGKSIEVEHIEDSSNFSVFEDPTEAAKKGLEKGICGSCPLKLSQTGACFVNLLYVILHINLYNINNS